MSEVVTNKLSVLRPLMLGSVLCAAAALSGCSLFHVYTIDVPQGTPITRGQAQQVQPGMSQNQVLYLLGSPALRDTLAPNRWDYVYDYQPGTYGKKQAQAVISNASQHVVVYFDSQGRVSQVEGAQTMPVARH